MGSWKLSIDIVQPCSAKIILDVVANAGLHVLAKAVFVGSARVALEIIVSEHDHFLEVRLFKPAEQAELRQLKIQELVLTEL